MKLWGYEIRKQVENDIIIPFNVSEALTKKGMAYIFDLKKDENNPFKKEGDGFYFHFDTITVTGGKLAFTWKGDVIITQKIKSCSPVNYNDLIIDGIEGKTQINLF